MKDQYVKIKNLMNTRQLAAYLHMSTSFVEKMRWRKVGPPYYKIGGRIFYVLQEVDDWLRLQRRVPLGGAYV